MAAEGKRRRIREEDVIVVYVNGSNALRLDAAVPQPVSVPHPRLSEQARANRERSMQMNFGYVAFLAVSAVISVLICVNYLKLQSEYTALQKQATGLEVSLSQLKLDNDEEYNRIMAGVDMEHVKEVAMDRLGMVYASLDQIVTYDAADRDYVKQYQEIPENG